MRVGPTLLCLPLLLLYAQRLLDGSPSSHFSPSQVQGGAIGLQSWPPLLYLLPLSLSLTSWWSIKGYVNLKGSYGGALSSILRKGGGTSYQISLSFSSLFCTAHKRWLYHTLSLSQFCVAGVGAEGSHPIYFFLSKCKKARGGGGGGGQVHPLLLALVGTGDRQVECLLLSPSLLCYQKKGDRGYKASPPPLTHSIYSYS